MEKVSVVRAFVTERLTAAAEEIFALVERTILEYEEELCRSKEENQRKQQLLDSLLTPQIQIHSVTGAQTEPSVEQRVFLTLNNKPEEQNVKQEEEELPEFTAVCVKSEEQSSLTQQTQRERESEEEPTQDDWEDRDHSEQTPFSEYMCGADSTDTSHISPEEAGRSSYSCAVSRKSFSKSKLSVHKRVHTGKRPYSCSSCDKTFTQKGHLNYHLSTHTDKRVYSCSVCKKTFIFKANLTIHMRTHTGEKPYSCLVCGRTFAVLGNRNVHMRTHTGEKPYGCSVCLKTFTQLPHLNRHMRTHSGERPYTCAICYKTYAVKSSLTAHERTHIQL